MFVIVMLRFKEVKSTKEAERLVGELKSDVCPSHNTRIMDAVLYSNEGEALGCILDAPRFGGN